MNQLHRPDLRCSADGSWECRHQEIQHVVVWGQASFDLADDVHHVGEALDHHQVLDFDAAGLANRPRSLRPRSTSIVLGPFLRVGKKFRFQFTILAASALGAGTGVGGGRPTPSAAGSAWTITSGLEPINCSLEVEGRTGMDSHRRLHRARGGLRDIGFETLAQHQLEYITSRDVLATCFNAARNPHGCGC